MNVLKFPRRVIGYLKKRAFLKDFASCDRSSGFGINGIGKGCLIEGKQFMHIGKDCAFGPGTELIALDRHFSQMLDPHLVIGHHVRMTTRCRVTCAGTITIGNDVLMAPEVFITDHNHGMDPTKVGGYSPQPLMVKDVVIEEGVWLGQRVCVLPGVIIGAHTIVGANSVVTHNIPAYCIAVGAPAKPIKKWNNENKSWEDIRGTHESSET